MKPSVRTRIYRQSMPWLLSGLLIVCWQIVSTRSGISHAIFPSPAEVLASFQRYGSAITEHALHTVFTSLIGFFLALIAGVLIGLAIGASAFVYSGVYPLLVAFNAIPKVALLPLFVIWCGIGTWPAVLTAFSLAFFPIVVNVATGLATIEPEMEDVMRALGARRDEILLKVGIPRSLPYLFASLKVAITLAFVGSVISETVASNEGIGVLMMAASSRFDVALVFAGLIVIAVLAVAAYGICGLAERRMAHWAFRGRGSQT
jgi:NitT/TauT family transport system permease protein